MKPRLYLETTIPSYLVARRGRDLRLAADQETTQQWWETERHDFLLFISTIVLKEVRRGDPVHAAAREAWLAGVPLLDDLPEAIDLAKRLLRDEIIPAVAADDATHVALAAAHRMDFLLTWNCPTSTTTTIVRASSARVRRWGWYVRTFARLGINETISHERKRNPRTNSSRSRGTRAEMQLRRGRHLR